MPAFASMPASTARPVGAVFGFDARPSPPSHGGVTFSDSGQWNVRERIRPDARGFARGFRRERAQNLVRRDRHFVDAHADRVEHRVGDRRHDRQQRSLADFLGAERSGGIRMLDKIREDLRHVEARRALVFEDRRELVHERVRQPRRQPAERLFFHQRFADSHVHAAFDLAARERRIDRAADVVRDPDARHGDPASVRIDVHFDDGGGVGVRRRRTDAAALESRRRLRRRVRTRRADEAELRFGHAHGFLERHAARRIRRVEDASIGERPPASCGIFSRSPTAVAIRSRARSAA